MRRHPLAGPACPTVALSSVVTMERLTTNDEHCCGPSASTAGSRLTVPDAIYDDIVIGVAGHAEAPRVGCSFDPRSPMGPLIPAEQRATVLGYSNSRISDFATRLSGGHCRPGFLRRTDGARRRSARKRAVTEEIFGPVVTAMRFTSTDVAPTRRIMVWQRQFGRRT
jgi:acyl-CoA reductase-like NAD-dependent aldehyde dehydrogenase